MGTLMAYQRVTFTQVHLYSALGNFDGPEQSSGMVIGRIQIVELCARTGLIYIHSD